MTTRFESELQEIERKVRSPRKGSKVEANELRHLETQRAWERQRDELTAKLGKTITLQWVDGEPKKWENCMARVTIGENTRVYEVMPYELIPGGDGAKRLKPRIITGGEKQKDGYKQLVEDWALWKWHSDRGSEVDDTGKFVLDCEAPKFEWEQPIAPVAPTRR
jgi:hypothetical protein